MLFVATRRFDEVLTTSSSKRTDNRSLGIFFTACGKVINSCVKLQPIKNSLRCYPRKISFNVALMRALALLWRNFKEWRLSMSFSLCKRTFPVANLGGTKFVWFQIRSEVIIRHNEIAVYRKVQFKSSIKFVVIKIYFSSICPLIILV